MGILPMPILGKIENLRQAVSISLSIIIIIKKQKHPAMAADHQDAKLFLRLLRGKRLPGVLKAPGSSQSEQWQSSILLRSSDLDSPLRSMPPAATICAS